MLRCRGALHALSTGVGTPFLNGVNIASGAAHGQRAAVPNIELGAEGAQDPRVTSRCANILQH